MKLDPLPAAALLAIATLLGCRPASPPPGGARSPLPADAAVGVDAAFAGIDELHAELAGRRGRAVLLNFWAAWCAPCIEELPDLAAASRDLAGAGLDVIGVSLDAWVIAGDGEIEARVRRALARAGAGYPNLIYRGERDPLVNAFELPEPIPHSILYDRDGRVVRRWNGRIDLDDLRREIGRLAGSNSRDG